MPSGRHYFRSLRAVQRHTTAQDFAILAGPVWPGPGQGALRRRTRRPPQTQRPGMFARAGLPGWSGRGVATDAVDSNEPILGPFSRTISFGASPVRQKKRRMLRNIAVYRNRCDIQIDRLSLPGQVRSPWRTLSGRLGRAGMPGPA